MSGPQIVVKWTETHPGFHATGSMSKTRPMEDGRIKISDCHATSDVTHVNPVAAIVDVLDKLARSLDVHPALMGDVTVTFSADDIDIVKTRGLDRRG